jgi:hypothetical protein
MDQEIHLTGLLIPVDWYANGHVKAVALATADEQEIAVGGPLLQNILNHLREKVDIWGTFHGPAHGKRFHVCRIQPVTPSNE